MLNKYQKSMTTESIECIKMELKQLLFRINDKKIMDKLIDILFAIKNHKKKTPYRYPEKKTINIIRKLEPKFKPINYFK